MIKDFRFKEGKETIVIRAVSISAAGAILSRIGKENMSTKRIQAARDNGKKGGRPSKYIGVIGNKGDWYFEYSTAFDTKDEAQAWLDNQLAYFKKSILNYYLNDLDKECRILTVREAWTLGIGWNQNRKRSK